jgi:hypothetical protein
VGKLEKFQEHHRENIWITKNFGNISQNLWKMNDFHEHFLENENFCATKFTKFRLILAFHKNKKHFRFNSRSELFSLFLMTGFQSKYIFRFIKTGFGNIAVGSSINALKLSNFC